MAATLIITLRETLEAALIIGLTLGYLKKTNQTSYNKIIYAAVAAGIIASILGALLFSQIAGGFTGQNEQIFEGITMLIGAGLITAVVLWMIKQKNRINKFKEKLTTHIEKGQALELFLLIFFAVLREGTETVIFLFAASTVITNGILGGVIGIIIAIILAYLLFKQSLKLPLKKFFNLTGILLILFAAGLTTHGIHELQEAGIIPIVIEHVWDINPEIITEGQYPLLHEKGHIGNFIKDLFGYNGNPSLIEVISYILYLSMIILLWKHLEKRYNKKNKKILS